MQVWRRRNQRSSMCTFCTSGAHFLYSKFLWRSTVILTLSCLYSCSDKTPSALFFRYNTQLGPPYRVLIDTNFINFSIRNKIDLLKGMMDCLYAECTPCITDCVMAELEKLGQKYRVALKIAKDPRFERLPCTHKGTYADDCICERVKQHRCYIAATCDKDLRRRIRKIPGVPIMYIQSHKYTIERLPEATVGGAPRT